MQQRRTSRDNDSRAAVIAELTALEAQLLDAGEVQRSAIVGARIRDIARGGSLRDISRRDFDDIVEGATESDTAPADRLALFFELRGELAKLNEIARDVLRDRLGLEENIGSLVRAARRVALVAQKLDDADTSAAPASPGANPVTPNVVTPNVDAPRAMVRGAA